jgi:hypothetical protein
MRTALVRPQSACSAWSFKSTSGAAASGVAARIARMRASATASDVSSVRVSPWRRLAVLTVSPMTVTTGCRRNAWLGSLAQRLLASRVHVE